MTDPMSHVTIAQIQDATAQHFGLSLPKLLNKRRLRCLARPRQVAMYLACELTESSLPQIGRAFDRHHTTIMHAHDLIRDRAGRDKRIAAAVDDITRQLTNDPWQ